MRDDPTVVALAASVAGSDPSTWAEIVEQYAPLVWSICTRFQLSSQDAEHVGQNVWLLLVEQLRKLREPTALPGWLATTTQRQCLRVVTSAQKSERLGTKLDEALQLVDTAIDEEILVAERNAALQAAFAEFPPRRQQLLAMLIADPPYSYAEISATLYIPVGSIGPQRARCLERLRRSSALTAYGEDDIGVNISGGEPGA